MLVISYYLLPLVVPLFDELLFVEPLLVELLLCVYVFLFVVEGGVDGVYELLLVVDGLLVGDVYELLLVEGV